MFRSAPVIALLCLAAIASPADRPGIWLDVPYVQQEKNGCGAAALAMILEYWQHRPADVKAIQRALYSPEARGIYASQMEYYLRGQGFRTFSLAGEWSDLKGHLEKGRPMIVALKPRTTDLHYVVVTGIDWQQNLVLTHDPAGQKLQKQHREEFEREWKAAANWALLAVPSQ